MTKTDFQVIPAMDLMDGKCVRLTQGDFSQMKKYAGDPVAMARRFEAAGFRRLHMVDLDGARSGKPQHLNVLKKVAAATSLTIDFSGGLKTDEDVAGVFARGAAMAAVGSVAVRQPDVFYQWLEIYGPDAILLGVDVRQEKLAVRGWTEQTDIGIMGFLEKMTAAGVRQVFCTDIAKDGAMAGPSFGLYQKILDRFPGLQLIGSGGVRSPRDVAKLKAIGCAGAIAGKAIYEQLAVNDEKWLSMNWVKLTPNPET
ncbi:MAG: HisA/HisF-related TIM barrel protein [Saprospiraceae bacterium]